MKREPASRKPMNARQVAFVESYLATFNASEAARRAGYAPNRARQRGRELLQREDVQEQIRARLEEMKCGADEVLARLAEVGRNAISEFLTVDGGHLKLDVAALEKAGKLHLIKGIKYDRSGRQIIEWADPMAALELLGRHHGLFKDHTELTGPGGAPVPVTVISIVPPNGK